MNVFKLLLLAWTEARDMQSGVAHYQRLSDHDLRDLGLSRGDIGRAAHDAAARRSAALEAAFTQRSEGRMGWRMPNLLEPVPSQHFKPHARRGE